MIIKLIFGLTLLGIVCTLQFNGVISVNVAIAFWIGWLSHTVWFYWLGGVK